MKRILLMVAAAMTLSLSATAQDSDLHNELSLSYGFGSVAQMGDGIGEGFIHALFSDTEMDDDFILGPISVEYFYHFNNPKWAVGGILSYSKWDSDVVRRHGDHEKVGERKRNFFSVMPSVKRYWILNDKFGLYSKLAAGIGYLNSKSKTNEEPAWVDSNGSYFMFQLSFAGLEYGKALRGFAEFGIGDQGLVMAGIRYKF
ncbi:MAG: outer membrane beta-barrel protein [Prevotella sp.]|nr:outer membrane beta-barrel protein [Prevotella sp.]